MITILLAVDGSDASIRATRNLIDLCAQYRHPTHIKLATVHLPFPKAVGLSSNVVTKDMIDQYCWREGQQMLAASRKLLDESPVAYESSILVGSVAESIVDHANITGCQMIYMGSRGMSAFNNVVLGSVATKVVHLSGVPVVLVP